MNKLHLRYVLLFAVALVLQLTVVEYIQIFNWRPDLVLIVLVFYALRMGPNLGMTAGFVTGLIQDLVSLHYLGLTALAKTVAGFTAGALGGKFEARTQYFLTLLISGLVHDFIYFLIFTIGENFSFQSLIFFYTIPNVLYTVILGGFIYYLTEAWISD